MKYALLGKKLSHSYSAIIHKEILKDLNIDAEYELLEISEEEIESVIDLLKKGIYSGFNVTIPYKKTVMKYLDEISFEALSIGSVNTIVYRNNKLIGYNTDYYGFYNTLKFHNIDIINKNCYILGTGGSSLAINKVLLDLGGNVTYVSRTPNQDNVISYEELKERKIDVLVNTTPVGMYPNMGVSPVSKQVAQNSEVVVDIIYNPRKTQLLLDANSEIDGLYMLVGQAIKAEEIWQDKEYNGSIEELLKRIELLI